jgi:hypothetical protein
VEIDDCTFHRCVRLGKFDADRTITFVPPDGEFELMRYRVTENVNLPFRLIPAVQEEGRNRVAVNIKVKANFNAKLFGTNVVIKVRGGDQPEPEAGKLCNANEALSGPDTVVCITFTHRWVVAPWRPMPMSQARNVT